RDEEGGYWVAVTEARPAPLVLEVRREGAVVARDALGAMGKAVQLEAVVWQASADALGRCVEAGVPPEGVVQIECTLRDAQDHVARDEAVVIAEVTGGALLALENGDLSDNTPY